MFDPVKMTIQRAKEILGRAHDLRCNRRVPNTVYSNAEVEALAQAFVDLTTANALLEQELSEKQDEFVPKLDFVNCRGE